VKKYEVLSAYSADTLASQVTNALNRDWKLVGEMHIVQEHRTYSDGQIYYEYEYFQVMVKDDDISDVGNMLT
jgi:hypothetical protein